MIELKPEEIKKYYLRDEIAEQIFSLCEDREVVPVFRAEQYGKRPSSIPFLGDFKYLVEREATSFHGSVELWSNPLRVESTLKKREIDGLRKGWDFIIDIDSGYGIPYAKTAVLLITKRLEIFGIDNYSIKFSGSRGFHIGISYKSFPEKINYEDIKFMYPDLARLIASYLRAKIENRLAEEFIKINPKTKAIMTRDNKMSPFNMIEIEQNWGVRHLFRMPYSFNEKTWLISLPLKKEQLKDFQPKDAKPSNVKGNVSFLNKGEKNEMKDLIMEALDLDFELREKEVIPLSKEYKMPANAISEENFPPCIKLILQGLEDGRKRAVFILINFLRTVGWSWDDIEKKLKEWNEKNADALRDVYISTQLNYAKTRNKLIPPPNCDNKGYYLDIKVCKPDAFCPRIKNPSTYTLTKVRNKGRERKKARKRV